MPTLSLVFWGLFGLLAIVGRALLQKRRTGSFGVTGISGAPGSIEWIGGVLFGLAIVLGVAAPILALADVAEPLEEIDTAGVHAAGIVLYALGLTGTLAAQLAMGSSWRIGVDESERTDLVTGGLFAIVRNPIYSAMLPTLVGLTLICPSLVAITALVLMIAALEIQTRLVEEPHLLTAHGDAYASYAARVGRFVPGVGKVRGA
jgi:protein-S-isoprenylcysteine O-methyltransferase Ste14